jgi:hypothetical protein
MTTADTLNTVGFIVTAVGGILGMFGALKQANGYYPFKTLQLLKHIFVVVGTYFFRKEEALTQIRNAAELAKKRPEDKEVSLVGIYFIFVGFLFQMAGAAVLLSASLVTTSSH